MTTGVEAAGWPVTGLYDPTLLHNYGGLALVNGTVYIALGGMCDNGNYDGGVVGVNAASAVRTAYWYVEPSGVYGGGVWGSGGVVYAPPSSSSAALLWTAAGNSKAATEWANYGEHVIALTPGSLTVAASYSPSALLDGVSDGDFGATPTVFTPPPSSGCTSTLVTVQHKSGIMFVLAAANLTHEFGRYQLAASTDNGQFITTATWSPLHALLFVSSPSDAGTTSASASVVPGAAHGLLAFNVTGPACTLSLVWHTSMGLPWNSADLGSNAPYTSPIVGGDVVWMGSGLNKGVHAVSAVNGTLLWSAVAAHAVFAAPVVASGRLIVADWAYGPGSVYMWGL